VEHCLTHIRALRYKEETYCMFQGETPNLGTIQLTLLS